MGAILPPGTEAMRLTKFSDYALRILIFAAAKQGGRATIEEAAEAFGISRAHLKKVVLHLTRAGFLKGMRGRTGGFALAQPPEAIGLGRLLRSTEPDFAVFECFVSGDLCSITRHCRLPRIAHQARTAFLEVFDRHTLADVLVDPAAFALADPAPRQPRGAAPPA